MRHRERSDKKCVIASVARRSIVEVRGDGLPRFARSDGNLTLAVTGISRSQ